MYQQLGDISADFFNEDEAKFIRKIDEKAHNDKSVLEKQIFQEKLKKEK
jgi:hypothetical protein